MGGSYQSGSALLPGVDRPRMESTAARADRSGRLAGVTQRICSLRRGGDGRLRLAGVSAAEPEPLGRRGVQRAPLHRRGISHPGRRRCCREETAVEGDPLELFDHESHLSKCSFPFEPFDLARYCKTRRAAIQRSRQSSAQLRLRSAGGGRDRLAGGALRSCVGRRAGRLAYGHSSVAYAVYHGSSRLRIGFALDSSRLSAGRAGSAARRMEMVDWAGHGEFCSFCTPGRRRFSRWSW